MQSSVASRLVTIALLSLALAACVARNQAPVALGNDDDDAVCRGNGYAVGSSEYVACRKDRDVQRNAAVARADRRHRDLAEQMLNNPVRP